MALTPEQRAALESEVKERNVDDLVKIFVKMRDRKSELAAAEAEIEEQQKIIEEELLVRATEQGVEGFKTAHGTTYISEDNNYSMADENTFLNFVRETGQIELLQRRVAAANIKQYMEEHNGELPPGLNWFKQNRMKIRRSAAK